MPSTDDIRKRQEARQLRKLAQQGHVEQAQTEAQAQSATSEANEAAKAPHDPSNVGQGNAAAQAQAQRTVAKSTRKETVQAKKAQAQRTAEVQAKRDSERSPAVVDVEKELERWNGLGSPPLHLLNAVAQKLDTETRDEGKDIASAAAKGAYDTFLGKRSQKRDRHARMRAQIAAGEAEIARREAQTGAS